MCQRRILVSFEPDGSIIDVDVFFVGNSHNPAFVADRQRNVGWQDRDTHMHGDDEYMDIEVMVMSAKIFADAIIRICG